WLFLHLEGGLPWGARYPTVAAGLVARPSIEVPVTPNGDTLALDRRAAQGVNDSLCHRLRNLDERESVRDLARANVAPIRGRRVRASPGERPGANPGCGPRPDVRARHVPVGRMTPPAAT